MTPPPRQPPWWRPFARRRWRRAVEQQQLSLALQASLRIDLPRQVAAHAATCGLARVGDCSASELAIGGGLRVPRRHVIREVAADPTTTMNAAAEMVHAIAAERGAGRVWCLPGLEIVHPVYDDGMLVRLDDNNRPIVVLRAVYFHEADAYVPPPPEIES